MSIIIALHGLPGVGKDCVADHLVKAHGFIKMAFADAVKSDLAKMFDVPVQAFSDRKTKEEPQGRFSLDCCDVNEFYWWYIGTTDANLLAQSKGKDAVTSEPRSPRWLMQTYGTDFRRRQSKDYWVNRLLSSISEAPADSNIVVTDVRFANEAESLARYATGVVPSKRFELWQIIRTNNPHFVKAEIGHASDKPLIDIEFDRTILNGGTLNQLLRKVSRTYNMASK